MKHRLAKTVVLWSVLTPMALFVVFFVLCFGLSAYSALETPFGYARLWLSPGNDVTRHVDFVLSAEEGRGRQVSDKIRLLEILEIDARQGSRLRYDRTILIKYVGDDMARVMDHLNYEEPMQRIAATTIVGGRDADLVRSAFEHYRTETRTTRRLCYRYAELKASGAFYNPAVVSYCPETTVREDVRKLSSE